MTKKIISCLLIVLLFVPAAVCAAGACEVPSDIAAAARAIYLVNDESGTVVFEQQADTQLPMASLTKLMTALIAIEYCEDLTGTVVTVPGNLQNYYDLPVAELSMADLVSGEQLSMYDMLHCLLLPSGNDAAVAIAEYWGYEVFISMMNQRAESLGCTNTHFVNPHGLDADGHYSSARDLYVITQKLREYPVFTEIAEKSSYELPATNMQPARTINSSILLQRTDLSEYYVDYIKGYKTGNTDAAGRCFVTRITKDGVNYTLVLLGCADKSDGKYTQFPGSFNETVAIAEWCFANLTYDNIIVTGQQMCEVPLRFCRESESALLYADGDLATLVYLYGDDSLISCEFDVPESVDAPLSAGEGIGTVTVSYDGRVVGTLALVTQQEYRQSLVLVAWDAIVRFAKTPAALIVAAVLAAALVWYIVYRCVIVRRMRKKNGGRGTNRRTRKRYR